MSNFDGLTAIQWPGTWTTQVNGTYPIVVDQDLRGTLQFVTGDLGSRLTDITGQRLEEGMLVYVKNAYTAPYTFTSGTVTRSGETYYQYKPLSGESRNQETGALPNTEDNWTEFTGGGGTVDNNLIFTIPSGQQNKRQLVQYKEGGSTYTVRAADVTGNMFNLTLATFTPVLSATGIPGISLNWDVECTGITVSVANPTDFLTQYISSVASVTQTSGVFGTYADFTKGPYSSTPVAGGSWTQDLTTNGTAVIQPISTTIAGGTASATIAFNSTPGGLFGQTIPITITWKTPAVSISTATLPSKTFLNYSTSTTYTVSASNVSLSSTYAHSITRTGGTISNPVGNGTFTFTDPVYYYNASATRTVTTTTTFTRPANVTGSQYDATIGPITSSNVSSSFTFPSFWLFTSNTSAIPTRSNIVSGNGFNTPSVTTLGNQTKIFAGYVTNTVSPPTPQAFWFGIRSSASQPTSIKAGTDPVFVSDVLGVQTASVALYPDAKPGDYVDVDYTLYGFTIQPGTLYISIS